MYMNRRVVLPLALGILLLSAVGIPSVMAADLDVGPGHTYTNITDAIAAANQGDTINVYDNGGKPYVYNETVAMTKQNLSLIGMGNVTIKPSNPEHYVVALSNNSVIKNFNIQGISTSYGVMLNDNTLVENNTISGNWIGIRGPGLTNVTIINNTITGNNGGIYLDSGNIGLISGNTISGNENGINDQGMNNLTITKNLISGNTDTAIHHDGTYNNTITENRIINNGAGIHIFSANDLQVHFNQIYGNTQYGLYNERFSKTPIEEYNGIVFAQNNWWGYNDQANVQSQIINVNGSVIFDPWLVLNVTSQTNKIEKNNPTIIIADLTYNSQGEDTFALYGQHLPDGILVTFSTTYGQLRPTISSTLNGKATTTLTSQKTIKPTVTATVDGQSVSIDLKIKKTKFREI